MLNSLWRLAKFIEQDQMISERGGGAYAQQGFASVRIEVIANIE